MNNTAKYLSIFIGWFSLSNLIIFILSLIVGIKFTVGMVIFTEAMFVMIISVGVIAIHSQVEVGKHGCNK